MIRVQSELGAIEVRSKVYDNPYNNKALPLIGGVVTLRFVVATRCIGHYVLFAFLVALT